MKESCPVCTLYTLLEVGANYTCLNCGWTRLVTGTHNQTNELPLPFSDTDYF